jgi:hypothetical protein
MTITVTSFPISKHTVGCGATPAFSGRHVLQFMWEVSLPPLPWSFPHTAPFTSFPTPKLLGRCCHSCLLQPACLFTVLWGSAPPRFHAQGALPSLLHVFCCCCCLLFSLLFSPRWGSVCPGGYADLAQGCLWEYRVPLSSPGSLCLLSW